jgi:opacity protein-like surface antigen
LNSSLTYKKSASSLGALFFALSASLAAFSGNASGAESVVFKAEIGVSLLRFDYREYNDSGRILDSEVGGIPGISLKAGQRITDWEWETAGSYHRGQVSYTGQTNLGAPYNTQTDETIGDVSLRAGYWFRTKYPVMPYLGIGYRRWDRDILPGSVNGLFESYRWKYLWLGLKQSLITQPGPSQFMLDVGLLKPINPEMRLDFKGVYPVSPVVYPESKIGLRIAMPASFAFSRDSQITLEPYYEYWRLGRSPIVTSGVVSVYEPASNTKNVGLNLRYGLAY